VVQGAHRRAEIKTTVRNYDVGRDEVEGFPVLRTERLVLREFKDSDAQAVFDIFSKRGYGESIRIGRTNSTTCGVFRCCVGIG
jgi:hypothetical protein